MSVLPTSEASIRDLLSSAAGCRPFVEVRNQDLEGRAVLVAARDPATAAVVLFDLDGIARRLVVCTPDLTADQQKAIAARASVDAVVTDDGVQVLSRDRHGDCASTEWVLLTSGTT